MPDQQPIIVRTLARARLELLGAAVSTGVAP
jgi:hypothetical protein